MSLMTDRSAGGEVVDEEGVASRGVDWVFASEATVFPDSAAVCSGVSDEDSAGLVEGAASDFLLPYPQRER
jgi:hypothetical protein